MDAISRGFLARLTFAFYGVRGHPEDAFELYSFHFKYGTDGRPIMTAGDDQDQVLAKPM